MSLSRTVSLSCWTALAAVLLWPTMAKLRSGSFVPALLKYENLPGHGAKRAAAFSMKAIFECLAE
jgi:hypothetical protein